MLNVAPPPAQIHHLSIIWFRRESTSCLFDGRDHSEREWDRKLGCVPKDAAYFQNIVNFSGASFFHWLEIIAFLHMQPHSTGAPCWFAPKKTIPRCFWLSCIRCDDSPCVWDFKPAKAFFCPLRGIRYKLWTQQWHIITLSVQFI